MAVPVAGVGSSEGFQAVAVPVAGVESSEGFRTGLCIAALTEASSKASPTRRNSIQLSERNDSMAIRILLLALGLAELLAPRRVVDGWMNLATTESDVELRPWVYTVARLEGLAVVLWVLAAGRGGDDE